MVKLVKLNYFNFRPAYLIKGSRYKNVSYCECPVSSRYAGCGCSCFYSEPVVLAARVCCYYQCQPGLTNPGLVIYAAAVAATVG